MFNVFVLNDDCVFQYISCLSQVGGLCPTFREMAALHPITKRNRAE
jgi:hypothetical protein